MNSRARKSSLIMAAMLAMTAGPMAPRMTTPKDFDETDDSTWEQHEARKLKAEQKRAMRNAKRLKQRDHLPE